MVNYPRCCGELVAVVNWLGFGFHSDLSIKVYKLFLPAPIRELIMFHSIREAIPSITVLRDTPNSFDIRVIEGNAS